MLLRIEAFTYKHGNKIPKKYTCDGEELSPGIIWDEVPKDTKSFALIMEGLDVPHRSTPLVLWVVYNIPGDLREIATDSLPEKAVVGTNDLGKLGYSGPCPQPGPDHQRYQVQLYALDEELYLPPSATKQDLVHAMKDHILDTARAIGTYERHKK